MMNTTMKVVLGFALLGVLAVSVNCLGNGGDANGQEMVIRTYQVPDGFDANQWAKTLNRTLYVNDANKVGDVNIGPNNTLIITAQKSAFSGIEQLIETFQQGEPAEARADTTVAVNYWTIVGRPIDGDAGEVRIASKTLSNQRRLGPALEEIARLQGATEFTLLEQIRLKSLSSQRDASIDGRFMKVSHRITSTKEGGQFADIKIQMVGKQGYLNSIESRVELVTGQFIVLGQSAINSQNYPTIRPIDSSDGLMLYYVLTSEID